MSVETSVNSSAGHGGRIFEVARELGAEPADILDFSASINPLGVAPSVTQALRLACEQIGHYPDSGSHELRHAISAQIGISAEQITVANGSTELIHLVPRLFTGSRHRALLIAPTFSEYANALRISGFVVAINCLSPQSGFSLDLSALKDEIARGYDIVFLCNPGNPTGRLYALEEVAAIHDLCRKSGALLLLDEAFIDFCAADSALSFLSGTGSMLILRSMTKYFGFPGIRLGYAVGSSAMIARLELLRPPWSVGVLAQTAGLAALEAGRHYDRTTRYVAEERGYLEKALATIPGMKLFPGAANYILLQLPEGMTAHELQNRLLAERILIRDCSNFTGLNSSFFRIAVRTRSENERLLEAVSRVFKLVSRNS